MSQVIVDANILVKLVLIEADSDLALQLWRGWATKDVERIAPAFFAVECCEFWTADEKFYRAAFTRYPRVKHMRRARRK